jgi:hypothetical protein
VRSRAEGFLAERLGDMQMIPEVTSRLEESFEPTPVAAVPSVLLINKWMDSAAATGASCRVHAGALTPSVRTLLRRLLGGHRRWCRHG